MLKGAGRQYAEQEQPQEGLPWLRFARSLTRDRVQQEQESAKGHLPNNHQGLVSGDAKPLRAHFAGTRLGIARLARELLLAWRPAQAQGQAEQSLASVVAGLALMVKPLPIARFGAAA